MKRALWIVAGVAAALVIGWYAGQLFGED